MILCLLIDTGQTILITADTILIIADITHITAETTHITADTTHIIIHIDNMYKLFFNLAGLIILVIRFSLLVIGVVFHTPTFLKSQK